MLMNWPERLWIYSPFRIISQKKEVDEWLRLPVKIEVDKALEIGCGLGRGARLLVQKMGFKHVFAFDLEDTLVKSAASSIPKHLVDNISFYVGDAQDLPFDDSVFDAVVNFGIIHHVLDWRRCIREISRVTRLGGIFYFEEIYPSLYANALLKRMLRHPTEDRFHEKEFLEALERNNFHLLDTVRTGSRYRIIGAAGKE